MAVRIAITMGVLVARLGAFAGPPLGGWMLANDIPAQTFLGVAALPALPLDVCGFCQDAPL